MDEPTRAVITGRVQRPTASVSAPLSRLCRCIWWLDVRWN